MKVYRWLIFAALLGCATSQKTSEDHVTVVWNRVDDVQTVCQNLSHTKEVFAIRGCSKWSDGFRSGERVCNIYVPAPRNEMDTQRFATLGHELLHCFDGNWHDRWGRMNPEETAAAGGSKKGAGVASSN